MSTQEVLSGADDVVRRPHLARYLAVLAVLEEENPQLEDTSIGNWQGFGTTDTFNFDPEFLLGVSKTNPHTDDSGNLHVVTLSLDHDEVQHRWWSVGHRQGGGLSKVALHGATTRLRYPVDNLQAALTRRARRQAYAPVDQIGRPVDMLDMVDLEKFAHTVGPLSPVNPIVRFITRTSARLKRAA